MLRCNYRSSLLLIMLLLLIAHPDQAQDMVIPGQLIMRVIPAEPPDSIVVAIGGEAVDSIPGTDMFLIEFPTSLPVENAIQILTNLPEVIFAQPNFEVALPEVQQMSIAFPDENAPTFLEGYSPGPLYGQPAVYSIGIDSSHLITGGQNTVVGVIDNGIDFTHPFLESFIDSSGFDFIDQDDLAAEEPGSAYGHGSFVAGLVRLVADEAVLLPIRAFNGDGVGNTFAVANAINLATQLGVDVINMSFTFQDNNASLEAVCANAVSSGIVLVAAAGNQASSLPAYPAALPGVIAVSGVDSLEQIADFSNYGPHIDVCAPGVNLYSALAGGYDWGTWSGTSFAAPLVSGSCALVRSLNAGIGAMDMEAHIRLSAETELAWGPVEAPDIHYGYGRIDAFDAVVPFSHGDVDMSGEIDIADIVDLVGYFFHEQPLDDLPVRLADFDCNSRLDIADIVSLVAYMFSGGSDFAPCY